MSRRLAIVLNPDSGKQETSQAEITKLFTDHNLSLKFFDITKGIDNLAKAIRTYKPQAVIAVGGDGTVNAVANIVMSLKLPMGIIADGTFNHFAKDLGLPLEPAGAAEVIIKNKAISVDCASVNRHVFVNNFNIGGYPEAVMKREQLSHIPSKTIAGLVAALHVGRRHSRQVFNIEIDNKSLIVRAGMLFVGNNRYELQGSEFTTRKQLDGGQLQVVIIKTGRFLHLLGILARTLMGGAHEKADIYTAHTLTIKPLVRQRNVAVDGEVLQLTPPFTITIHPKALTVLV